MAVGSLIPPCVSSGEGELRVALYISGESPQVQWDFRCLRCALGANSKSTEVIEPLDLSDN